MKRQDILDHHLQEIYIFEDVNKALGKMKSKKNDIIDALKNGDILRFNKTFQMLPDLSPKEAKSFSMKTMKKEYQISEKHINAKMKKAPEDIKTALIVMRASLYKMKEDVEDTEIKNNLNEKIDQLDAALNKAGAMLVNKGVNIMFIAVILRIFVSSTLGAIGFTAGFYGTMIGLMIYMIAFLVKVFVEAKKAGERVIS